MEDQSKNPPVQAIPVNTGIDTKMAYNTISKDVGLKDCILDLIDNSIDAARHDITLHRRLPVSQFELNLEGYEIRLTLREDYFSIEDNCSGVDKARLINDLFFLGSQNNQTRSIGAYGVGFTRALWKIGKIGLLVTDNSNVKWRLPFNCNEFNDPTKQTIAHEAATDGKKGTLVELRNLTPEAAISFGDQGWIADLREQASVAYAVHLGNGLQLTFNGMQIHGNRPLFREDMVELSGRSEFTTSDGLKVLVRYGVHEAYRFKEDGVKQDKATKSRIIDQCGWYISCNGRVIVRASKARHYMGAANWHSEYNGFLGWISFQAEDSKLLPWNSAKNGLIEEKQSVLEALDTIKQASFDYRSANKRRMKAGEEKGFTNDSKGGGAAKESRARTDPPVYVLHQPTIQKDPKLLSALNTLGHEKLKSLYSSLIFVDLRNHAPILYVGASCFLETLCLLLDKASHQRVEVFLEEKYISNLSTTHTDKGAISQAVANIRLSANIIKHHKDASCFNGQQLAVDWKTITPMLLWLIDEVSKVEA